MTNFIYNILIYFFGITHDMGISVILLTVLVRGLLWPLSTKSLKSQSKMTAMQSEMARVKEQAKGDKAEQSRLLMELYKEKGVNPLSSCLPLLVQLPIVIALFSVFKDVTPRAGELYSWVASLPHIKAVLANMSLFHPTLFGVLDVSRVALVGKELYFPGLIVALLAGLTQYIQTQMLVPDKIDGKDQTQQLTKQMNLIFPFLIIWLSLTFPIALPLYWVVFNVLTIIQQKVVLGVEVKLMERLLRWRRKTPAS